jgi:hypothetical protein
MGLQIDPSQNAQLLVGVMATTQAHAPLDELQRIVDAERGGTQPTR